MRVSTTRPRRAGAPSTSPSAISPATAGHAGVGVVVIFATWAASILFGILAAKATNEGRYARYPFAIDFVS